MTPTSLVVTITGANCTNDECLSAAGDYVFICYTENNDYCIWVWIGPEDYNGNGSWSVSLLWSRYMKKWRLVMNVYNYGELFVTDYMFPMSGLSCDANDGLVMQGCECPGKTFPTNCANCTAIMSTV